MTRGWMGVRCEGGEARGEDMNVNADVDGDIVQTKPGDYLGISRKGDEWRVVGGITSKWVDGRTTNARRKKNKITTPLRGRATR